MTYNVNYGNPAPKTFLDAIERANTDVVLLQEITSWHAANTGAFFPAQRIIIGTPTGDVQLLNVHLRPAIENGSWVKGFLTTPKVRQKEIAAHWDKIDTSLPTIVAGDFNEDPDGLAIRFLAERGFARVPTTGPTTWHYEKMVKGKPWDLLKMDIDHVLVDGTFTTKDAHVVDAGTSDHRPVVVTIETK
jgi:endonuclease/exonuclease/phosphatase family metal-dependent hydrolase